MSGPQENPELLAQLVEEWQALLRKGEKPELDDYTKKYPDLAEDIRQLLPGLAALENLKGEALDRTIAPTGGLPIADGGPKLEQLGDYRILREVGRGGMGVVYEAEQISLGRHVALKVLPQKVILDARQKRRFEREAKAAAKLHHTNIVPVFGVGEHDGMPYYVMQFIQGLGLDAVMDELKRIQGVPKSGEGSPAFAATITRADVSAADVARSLLTGHFNGSPSSDVPSEPDPGDADKATVTTPAQNMPSSGSAVSSGTFSATTSSIHIPGLGAGKAKKQTFWQSVAAIGAQVADALDYAHTQGILHRDIKPSNLLLDTRGTVWVTDFGLAKATDHHDDLTHTGDVLGTLRYMPSEAFEGKSDARGDIYSLGLTLYEMLALQPAFGDKDRNQLVKHVTSGEPERLNRLNRQIPRDLVTVIHKAIDREPGRRYQTAREFASDLERFVANEPVLARRSGAFERTLRWVRRRPAAAALIGVSAIAAMALAASAIVLLYSQELQRAKANAEQARADAEHARDAEALQRKATEVALMYAENQRELAVSAQAEAEKQREQAILQRGLLAVHTEQWAEAVKDLGAYSRAHPDDLKAWLGLAKAHNRLGQFSDATLAYINAIRVALASDVESKVEAHLGWAEASTGAGDLDAAISHYDQAFLLKPDQIDQATAFARTLYEKWAGWRVLMPIKATASGGVTLKPQPDGSIFQDGNSVNSESFTIVAKTDLAGIRAFRLEILPEIPQPVTARGGSPTPRYQNGNFVLAEFTATAAAAGGVEKPVVFNHAWADYSYPAYYYYGSQPNRKTRQGWDVSAAIDGDPQTGWSVLGQYGRAHTAVFATNNSSSGQGETTLTVQIRFSSNMQLRMHNILGRFRLSVSTREPAPAWECLVNLSSANGWTKLAAARFLNGADAAALDALGRADKTTGDQISRQFLHSLLFEPAQKTEAKTAYERTVAQVKNNQSYAYGYGDLTNHWLVAEASSRWLENEPSIAQYRRNRAEALVAVENWTDAIADFDQLIEKDAADYRLLLDRGLCFIRLGKPDKASADFLAAGKLNADESVAWHRQKMQSNEYMADSLSTLPHVEACVAIEKGKPSEAEFLVKRGRLYSQLGRKADATQDFAQALKLNPNSPEALLERGGARAEQGDLEGAKEDFAAARRLGSPTTLMWHLNQLNRFEYGPNRNLEVSLLHLGEIVELDSAPASRSQYLLRRVNTLRQLKRWNEALTDYDRVIQLFPRQIVHRVERADCLINLGQHEKAVDDLAEAIKIDRDATVQQIRWRAAAAEQSKDWLQEMLYLDACLKIKLPGKDEAEFLRKRAKALVELNLHAAAIRDCERALELAPGNFESSQIHASAYVAFAQELRLQGRMDEAKQVAQRARSFLKARADSNPQDDRYSIEFINFLLTEAAAWRPVEIDDVRSAGGATFTKLPDSSFLASGANPSRDVYSLSAKASGGMNALRLDVLPDQSLPGRGPGRSNAGDFHLTDIHLDVARAKSVDDFRPVRWRGAFATYIRPVDTVTGPRDGPRGAIDGLATTRWDIWPRMGTHHSAIFATDEPVGRPESPTSIKVRFEFKDPAFHQFTLGRFRLACSTSPYAIHIEQILPYTGGNYYQMAAALAILGEQEEASAAFNKAEAAPDSNDGGVHLLRAWTAQLLGLDIQARAAREKAVAWFAVQSFSTPVPLPAVAIDVFTRAAKDGAGAIMARRWLARAYEDIGDYEQALTAYGRAIHDEDENRDLYQARGTLLRDLKRWKPAVADLQKAIRPGPDEHLQWLYNAPLYLLSGDEEGYRRHRAALLQRFGDATEAYVAERVAKAASFLPGTPAETKLAVELAKRAVTAGTHPQFHSWFHLAYALASYRAADYATVVEQAHKALEVDANYPVVFVKVGARLLEAIAQQALGKHEDALRLLNHAEHLALRDLPTIDQPNLEGNFHDLILCQTLLHEARQTITPDAARLERGPAAREVR